MLLRNLMLVLFIIPKLVIWPLIWLIRCKRKNECSKDQDDKIKTAMLEVQHDLALELEGEEQLLKNC